MPYGSARCQFGERNPREGGSSAGEAGQDLVVDNFYCLLLAEIT